MKASGKATVSGIGQSRVTPEANQETRKAGIEEWASPRMAMVLLRLDSTSRTNIICNACSLPSLCAQARVCTPMHAHTQTRNANSRFFYFFAVDKLA